MGAGHVQKISRSQMSNDKLRWVFSHILDLAHGMRDDAMPHGKQRTIKWNQSVSQPQEPEDRGWRTFLSPPHRFYPSSRVFNSLFLEQALIIDFEIGSALKCRKKMSCRNT